MIFYISFHKDILHQQQVMCDCYGCVNFHWPWELLTTHLQPLGIAGILILIQRGFHYISICVTGRDVALKTAALSELCARSSSATASAETEQTELLTVRRTLHMHEHFSSNEIQF